MVAHDLRIRAVFTGGVVWVTVGENAAGPDLAGKLVSVARLFDPIAPEVTDPLAAGTVLGRALDGQRVLLVVDDVWSTAQVEPFLTGGDGVMRLFITRQPGVLPADVAWVRVDQMSDGEAHELLTAGFPSLPPGMVMEALRATGRWPVLVSLVHGAVRDAVQEGGDPVAELRDVVTALRVEGVTALDARNVTERAEAVAATIEVSLRRLTPDEHSRYRELAVFGENVTIPGEVVARLWGHTGGWTVFQARRLCRRLFGLGLLASYRRDPDRLALHDMIRAYLRNTTNEQRAAWNAAVVDAHRDLLPSDGGWADLPARHDYLWSWLATHLSRGGRRDELEAILADPRWLAAKLEWVGPAGLESDLRLSEQPTARALAIVVRQNAHLLGPLDPRGSLAATFASRLPDHTGLDTLRKQILATAIDGPHLRTITQPPDLPHDAVVRVLTGHTNWVIALAVAPDGGWLASAGNDTTVRIWDLDTGQTLHILTGHTRGVLVLAVHPDGRWLVSTGFDQTVRVWDAHTGQTLHTFSGHTSTVTALAVAGDGSWLASAGNDKTVRIWEPTTGRARYTLTGHTGWVTALAVAPDGGWLASASADGTVRVWDAHTGDSLHTFSGHSSTVTALAVAGDGSWLASAGNDTTLRVWDPTKGRARYTLTGHTNWVAAQVVSPVGGWLASASYDKTVRIWDPRTGHARHILTRQTSGLRALALSSEGDWLASSSNDGVVRIWDLRTDWARYTLTGHTDKVASLAVAPDGSWLASAGDDKTVRIWDASTGRALHTLIGHTNRVGALAVAPDGSWLASAGHDKTVRIWDPSTGRALHTLTGHTQWVAALAVAPDGSWLASASGEPFGGGQGEIRVWDAHTGLMRRSRAGHATTLRALLVAPDGSWLASASDKTVQIWDPSTGTTFHTLTGHTGTVTVLAVAPDGSWLASASDDKTVRIWDPTSGRARHTLSGHTHRVAALAVAPDGRWLVQRRVCPSGVHAARRSLAS